MPMGAPGAPIRALDINDWQFAGIKGAIAMLDRGLGIPQEAYIAALKVDAETGLSPQESRSGDINP